MSINLKNLEDRKLIHPPKWLTSNVHYLVIMGSRAYGTETPESDYDIYGWCIPPLDVLFPWRKGLVYGFDNFPNFEQFEVKNPISDNGKELSFNIYNITKYFYLCANNNPNMLNSLYVPQNCILTYSPIGQMVRENRHLFLSKKVWITHKSYSFAQLKKMQTKEPSGKRKAIRDEFGYDVKFAMNVVRLLYEVEQLLQEGDVDLQLHKEHLKAIRRGDIKYEDIVEFFHIKEKELEKAYHESKLPYSTDMDKVRQLLINCLEHHYGSLDKCIAKQKEEGKAEKVLSEIDDLLDKYYNSL